MENLETDDNFAKIMKKSRLEMPFSDFEDNMMQRIQREAKNKDVISNNMRLSLIFFLLGSIFGLFVGDFLTQSTEAIFNIPKEKALLFFQLIYLLVFLNQLNSLIKLWKVQRLL